MGVRVAVGLAVVLGAASCGDRAWAARCENWVATIVSVQGVVDARTAGAPEWVRAGQGDVSCPGDLIRIGARSRAAVVLRSGGVLRLDQNTTMLFPPEEDPWGSWIEVLSGVVYFFTRVPRSLSVLTPFVNAAVEGTEFVVAVGVDETAITVFEGQVTASNPWGRLMLAGGQSATARAGEAPALRPVVVTPTDAVQWALYYPPVLALPPEALADRPGEGWLVAVRRSIERASAGDLAGAFASLDAVPPGITDPRLLVYRAGLLLAVGRADEAARDIARALALEPADGAALALRAIVAVAQNDRDEALRVAERAVALGPGSASAHLALSYARQARFDLDGARASAQEAVRLRPDAGLTRARLAELELSFGRLGEALAEAREAARRDPNVARTQSVLGFAHLMQVDLDAAARAFERAIALDQAAPLPRLGLGLTTIRRGQLAGGVRELEIAVSLDPGDSLLRSYLGKAYYEEKRDRLSAEELGLAKRLDPRDPTPWLYDAIRLQSINRPSEALAALQRSIALNDNRAVYRSRLLLDQDLATRSANRARIYDDLGFQQLALVEGWKSLAFDPASHSAHRFLADSYSVLPRHETARASELLQAQLLQPINIVPVQPQLALSKTFILPGLSGPADPAFNELNPLFERNRAFLLANGVVGGNQTYGDQAVLSGIWDRLSMSAGQLYYTSDGFRPNNDLRQEGYNLFAQLSASAATSLQAEFRSADREEGDLPLRFDPTNFSRDFREDLRTRSFRTGMRYAVTPSSMLIGSFIYEHAEFDAGIPPDLGTTRQNGWNPEAQYLLRAGRFSLVTGLGYLRGTGRSEGEDIATTTGNGYAYSQTDLPWNLTVTVGLSVDAVSNPFVDVIQPNPKLGVIWTPFEGTTLRAALLRTLQRTPLSGQTIEPTQVAGFNQLYDDAGVAADTWRWGAALDQQLTDTAFAGVEGSRRDLEFPYTRTVTLDWAEDLVRAYVYWTPLRRLALRAEYRYEHLERSPLNPGEEQIVDARTHLVPVGLGYFDPSGLGFRLTATFADQSGRFLFSQDPAGLRIDAGSDQFWVVDASVFYRLPRRLGLITLEARNLLDQGVRFNDTDPVNPTIYPERLVLLRITLAY